MEHIKEEFELLLLKDLCARLPYKIVCSIYRVDDEGVGWRDAICKGYYFSDYDYEFYFEDVVAVDNILHIKPYLRPLSSITEEEKEEIKPLFSKFIDEFGKRVLVVEQNKMALYQDWLNKKMFDYRGLIGKGLAIEVTKENNPYETRI